MMAVTCERTRSEDWIRRRENGQPAGPDFPATPGQPPKPTTLRHRHGLSNTQVTAQQQRQSNAENGLNALHGPWHTPAI